MRTATKPAPSSRPRTIFQSSRSLRTATRLGAPLVGVPHISILAVLADRDVASQWHQPPTMYFNPRGPCGPRPGCRAACPNRARDFNPRGPCGPRRQYYTYYNSPSLQFQSSRSLRTATKSRPPTSTPGLRFQSSRSLRTATFLDWNEPIVDVISILAVLADRDPLIPALVSPPVNFNPRGPCGPRPWEKSTMSPSQRISILAVLADRDRCDCGNTTYVTSFQSSRSLRTATKPGPREAAPAEISILAVLADRD